VVEAGVAVMRKFDVPSEITTLEAGICVGVRARTGTAGPEKLFGVHPGVP
jgi:hypothetical protein